MSKPPLRQRLLHGLDQLFSRIPPAYLGLPRNQSGQPLSPFLQGLRYLRQLDDRRNGNRGLLPTMMRQKFRTDMLAMRVGFAVGSVMELSIPSPAEPLAARLYRPSTADAVSNALPVLLVFFHGGGFVMGDLDTHDDACRLLCDASQMPMLSVAYRLAPEHPFPAAVDDAHAAVQWALEHRADFAVQAVAVGGDSAGANLAAVTAQRLADTDLLAQLLIYPGTDMLTARPAHQRFGQGYFLNQTDRSSFYGAYLGNRHALKSDPRVSPLLNATLDQCAPALVVTAGFDMLCDEGEAYATHLNQHGIHAEHLRFEQLGHAFINLAAVHADSKAAVHKIAQHWHALCQQQLTGVTA